MLRHGQDRARLGVMASATAHPVDTGAASGYPVDTTRRPRAHVDGAGPTMKAPMWMGRADDEGDYFGNCPRSTCGRGERQRLGMIMREKV